MPSVSPADVLVPEPVAGNLSSPLLLGIAEPRLFTEPLRPLTRKTTRGYEAAEFAEMTGEPLMPWQKFAAVHGLELNPDGSYRFRIVLILVARQNGKSHLKRTLSLWRMFMEPPVQIGGFAQDVSLAREQWHYCQQVIHGCSDLEAEWGRVRLTSGDEWFELSNGSKYIIGSSNGKAMRGRSFDEVTIDELREQHDWRGWAALSKTTMARANSQIWLMSNAGDDQSVVLNQLRDAAMSGRDPSICLLEWSAPDGCELEDETAIRQANPGLGYTVSLQAIKTALSTDPPEIFRTEVLCQRVDSLDSAIDMGAWRDCTDPSGNMEPLKDRVVASFDVAPDSTHCSLVVAARLADGRVRVEVAGGWKTTEEARQDLPGLLERISPIGFAWYPTGPGAAFAPMFRKLPSSIELKGQAVPEACQILADLIKGRRIVHAGEALLNAQITGASKLASGDGWRFTRKGPAGHVDAAYACAGAVKAALEAPEPRKAVFRSFSL